MPPSLETVSSDLPFQWQSFLDLLALPNLKFSIDAFYFKAALQDTLQMLRVNI